VRPDKKPDEATSSEQILDMYYAQDSVVEGGGDGSDDMDLCPSELLRLVK